VLSVHRFYFRSIIYSLKNPNGEWGVARLYCSALFSQVSRCLRHVFFTPFNLLEQENSQISIDLFFYTIVEQLNMFLQ
jgi:hypothetical protein